MKNEIKKFKTQKFTHDCFYKEITDLSSSSSSELIEEE